jgi:predicted alpha/beta-fold hydrolase
MAKALIKNGFDVLAWNYRGCSGEMNNQPRFYHSGATDDLHEVVQHAIATRNYHHINLIGFSLGGNLTLKYLGEQWPELNKISQAVAISVPLDLTSSSMELAKPKNWIYTQRFLKSLKRKIIDKRKKMNFPLAINFNSIATLIDFDDQVTAPLHGFKNALDYYAQSSSLQYLRNIKCKTLIINAKNDPFLSPACYPEPENPLISVLYPDHGGHVGFTLFNSNGLYWSEIETVKFFLANSNHV